MNALYKREQTDDPRLQVRRVTEAEGETFTEYYFEIENRSEETVRLGRFGMFSCRDLTETGLEKGPYKVFRSGRHKNDLPGVFVTGCRDERMADVAAAMTEAGDAGEGKQSRCVVSDHLTMFGDGSGRILSIAFLTGRDQLFETLLSLDEEGNLLKVSASVLFGIDLLPGKAVRTETIRIALVEDAVEEAERFAARKAALYGARNRRRPAVFCTWYYYELFVTYEDVKRNLAVLRDRKLPYDVFQVDEGWEVTLGEYVPNGKFPVDMAAMAQEIREAGFIPGLWSSPFVAHETASVWKEHPEWMLRDKEGNPCLFPMNDTVYCVFDITNPATWEYFRQLYHRFTFEWGYTYHKLDFTRAAVIYEDAAFFDRTITMAQAFYRAVKAIREGMGEEAFFLMCGGLYDPVIGLVDAQRTGSDVLSMWSSNINKNGKTAPFTIRQSLMRYYMNRWWANDPDALMIRKNEVMEFGSRLTLGLLNDDEVRTSVVNQFTGGGIMCQTEPLDKITDDRLLEIRHILPVVKTTARPLCFMEDGRFPGPVCVTVTGTGAQCICMTNWSDTEEMEIEVDLGRLKLDPLAKYAVCGFYSREYRIGAAAGDTVTLGRLRPHASEVVKVEPLGKRPVIVASDAHYSMGGELSALSFTDGYLRLETSSGPLTECHYLVFCPEDGITREITVCP